ncbi:hypothetical protein pneo_cds_431 [Pandoravirus neocaledonia]|uniref:Uncharacterized protein n=1 Tax=Pandoravirus neocaledonia TaxID=2107708 RepID=A0A2U7UC45_9VIRU|nr:hypothetical protein pneo_cds_431 [Pandoravirus neocaledonia]AVK76038.1 hypothetical protein pneo_cds_431 [Pandoravirus neocaledonia]
MEKKKRDDLTDHQLGSSVRCAHRGMHVEGMSSGRRPKRCARYDWIFRPADGTRRDLGLFGIHILLPHRADSTATSRLGESLADRVPPPLGANAQTMGVYVLSWRPCIFRLPHKMQ